MRTINAMIDIILVSYLYLFLKLLTTKCKNTPTDPLLPPSRGEQIFNVFSIVNINFGFIVMDFVKVLK